MASQNYTVQGTIFDQTGKGIPGLVIRAFDDDPHSERDLLGTAVCNSAGKYVIAYNQNAFARPVESGGADIIIIVYTPEGKQLYESARHPNVPKHQIIDVHLTDYPAKEETGVRLYTLNGKIVNDKGIGIAGQIVQAFKLDSPTALRSGSALCSPVLSKDDGSYEIEISLHVPKSRIDNPIDIALSVSTPSGKELSRTTHYRITMRKEFNVIIPSNLIEEISEFEKLGKAILRYIQHPDDLRHIKENDEEEGVTYLSRKTRWDARLVGMYVLAQRYGGDKVPAEFLYALYRSGVSSTKDALYRVNVHKALELFEQAVKSKIIPSRHYDTEQIMKAFKARSSRYLLQSKSQMGLSTMGEMLSMSLSTQEEQADFIDLYYHGDTDAKSRWKQIETRFGKKADALRFDGQLGYLSFHNANLISRLKNELKPNSPLDLVKQGLYEENEWDRYLDDAMIPEAFGGDTVEERRTQYKQWMAFQLTQSYPTAVIAEKILNGTIRIDNEETLKAEVYDALYTNGFVLGKDSINRHIETLTLSEAAKKELQRIHRTFQLSPSDTMMSQLLERNLDSAFKITRQKRETFIAMFDPDEREAAGLVHDKASADAALTTHLALGYQLQKINPVFQALGAGSSTAVKSYPKLEELFGDLDYCSCGHCESILSPAAYFVDLLQFLNQGGTNSPINRLLQKRPDLEHIELTCSNTETVLPYVDLVNEILEYWVAQSGTESLPAEPFKDYNTEESITSEELLAYPHNVNKKAYEILEDAVFPLNLPFSRNLELIRNYFGSLKTPLYQGMEILRRDESYSHAKPEYGWREIFTEQLGLSPAFFEVLTDSTHHRTQTLFGYAPGTDLEDVMPDAKTFCRRLGIEYDELVSLLKTRFINPISRTAADRIALVRVDTTDEPRGCSFETITLGYAKGGALHLSEYMKILRFVRLYKHLGWSIEQTDDVIETLSELGERLEKVTESEKWTLLDEGFEELIVKIALFERVRTSLNAKPKEYSELLVLWHDMDSVSEMTLENIAATEGYRQLATRLKLSLEELLDAITLSGIDPLGSFDYLDTDGRYQEPDLLRFIAFIQKIRASKLRVSELNYLFMDKDVTGSGNPTHDELFGVIAMLHEGLREQFNRYPAEAGISDEKAQELLLAVYGEAGANAIIGIFTQTRRFSVPYAHTTEALSDDIAGVESKLRYDDLKKELTYEGVMSENVRNDFLGLSGVSAAFKTAIEALYAQGQAVYEDFVRAYPELADLYGPNETLSALVLAKLPQLIGQVQHTFVHQQLSDQLDIKPEMANVLFEHDDERCLLHTAEGNAPILSDFVALQHNGISACYYNESGMNESSLIRSEEHDGTIIFDSVHPLPKNTNDATLPISALWHFYLKPDITADCNLYLEVSPGAEVSLLIDGKTIEGDIANNVWSNKIRISLEAGRFYEIRIEARNLHTTAILSWKQGDRFKELLPAELLFPYSNVQNCHRSYRRLLKMLQLIRSTALSPEEVRYFARDGVLDTLPVNGIPTIETVRTLFNLFLDIVDYSDLKNRLNVRDDGLVAFFQNPEATYDDAGTERSILYKTIRWVKEDVDTVVKHFMNDDTLQMTERELAGTKMLSKAAELFAMLKNTGLNAAQILECCTPYPDADRVASMQEALQNRYDEEAWLKLSKIVHDKMRTAQRDALVAYILHVLQRTGNTHIDTPDKLFEYFLIDVQMDACMKTSRIKQGISSVQLFIERCLHNLEQDVAPESIDALEWEWRKRYRVWEANRKVFLYPENWLDPSLRSTKSPFFKEFENELLQSDINDDLAAKALLNYLEKLDRVSQLEICGLCKEYEETEHIFQGVKINDQVWTNRLHVIGRTAGIKQEYFHRRYDGTWSAWEKIALDLEDGPVIPVFWKGRLFLFWTTVILKGTDNNVDSIKTNEEGVTNLSSLKGAPKIKVEVNLNWSEFYNGKWQDKRTSDFMDPVTIEDLDEFKRSSVRLRYVIDDNDTLTVVVTNLDDLPYCLMGSFVFLNTHSLPEKCGVQSNQFINLGKRIIENDGGNLVHNDFSHQLNSAKALLHNNFYNIADFAHPVRDVNDDPFFLNDYRHLFFVDPQEITVSLSNAEPFEPLRPDPDIHLSIPELIEESIINPDPRPGPMDWGSKGLALGDEKMIAKVLNTNAGFVFDGVMLGISGRNTTVGGQL